MYNVGVHGKNIGQLTDDTCSSNIRRARCDDRDKVKGEKIDKMVAGELLQRKEIKEHTLS